MRTILTCAVALVAGLSPTLTAAELPRIKVAPDRRGFVTDDGRPFIPWGVNYDHDDAGRLLEDYWVDEWERIVGDFREMRELGFNVVRIHLQLGKFLASAGEPDRDALGRLKLLIDLAEREGLYLDLTGLGCYHKQDVPAWYDALDESGRWAAQRRFWQAVATTARDSSAIFCYDLMNEPVVPGGQRKDRDWLGPAFAGKHFVQFITLDQAGRPRPEIARAWIDTLVDAIREVDQRHLITVGLVPWSLDRPGLTSGFVPEQVAGKLDFIAMHVYPEAGQVDEALETLKGFAIGKPVVIEETFPLRCSLEEMDDFLSRARDHAAGVISFYWGKTPEELAASGTLRDAIQKAWLERFRAARWK